MAFSLPGRFEESLPTFRDFGAIALALGCCNLTDQAIDRQFASAAPRINSLPYFGLEVPPQRSLIMEIGARNRLMATVTEIKRGSVMCQVKVKLAGGEDMESVMTLDSLSDMNLKVGDKVRVAVKAVNVLLLKE